MLVHDILYSRGNNVWQKLIAEDFSKKFWQMKLRSTKRLLLIWMVFVWQIVDDSPNSPNLTPAELSCYITNIVNDAK